MHIKILWIKSILDDTTPQKYEIVLILGFYPRPNRLNFESAKSTSDNQRSLTDIARDEKASSNKAHATISLPPASAQILNNQQGSNHMMHMHASKTYSHSGGKGPAPPVPSLQTQQSAPHRLINDNVQVTSKYDTFFLLKIITLHNK